MIDNRTPRLGLLLPDADNYLEDDVVRLSESMTILDTKVATVDGNGKIPVDQLPAVAITDTFTVNTQAAMLALNAQPGDVAIRSDISKTFILMEAPATTLANWKELVNDALVQLSQPDGYLKVGGLDKQYGNIQNTREQWRRQLEDAGLNLVAGSFEEGATVQSATDAVWHIAGGRCYSWDGGLPKTVPAGSTPDSSGGIAAGAWVSSSLGLMKALRVAMKQGGTVQDSIVHVTPFMFGGIGGSTTVDNTDALLNAIAAAKAFKFGIDLRGGPWRINKTADFTGVYSIIADMSGRILLNPVGFTALHTANYAVTFGNPDTGYSLDRNVFTTIKGLFVVISDNRNAALNGVYFKGQLLDVDSLRIVGFDGSACTISATWDSRFGSISCETSGNISRYQFEIVAGGDTSNCLSIGRIQSERAYHRCMSITCIRSVINTIHAERTAVLTTDDGTTAGPSGLTYRNFNINVGNTTINQIVHDCLTTGTAPDGSALAATVCGVRLNLDYSSIRDSSFTSSYIDSTFGRQSAYDEVIAMRWYFDLTSFVGNTIRNARITERLYPAANNTFIGGIFAEISPVFNASSLNFSWAEILSLVFPNNIVGDITFTDCRFTSSAMTLGDTKSPAGYAADSAVNETRKPVTFVRCSFAGPVAGAFRSRAVFMDCFLPTVSLASRAVFEFYNCSGTSFSYTGDRSFITRNCRFTTVTGWGQPTHVNHPVGVITERLGPDSGGLGSIFRCTDSNTVAWTKLA